MKLTVTLPAVVPGTTIYVVAEWRKKIGEAVAQGEPLALVRPASEEGASALPIPSPSFGVLSRLGVLAGEAIEVGEPLAILGGVPEPLEAERHTATIRPTSQPIYVPAGPEEAVSLSPTDRALAEHFALSARTAPHVFTVATADVSEPLRLIARSSGDPPLTLPAFVIHAAVAALRRFPALNAQRVSETEVRRKGYIHIGIALSGAGSSLQVPVVRDADRKSIPALAREVADVTARFSDGTLTEPDVRPGATFTVGETTAPTGVLYQTPLLHRPQVAFLSFGPVMRIPVAITDSNGTETIAIRPQITLCLAHDARIVDSAEAAAFLGAVVEGLSDAAYLFA